MAVDITSPLQFTGAGVASTTLVNLGGVPTSRTINGVDLSADRSLADIGAASNASLVERDLALAELTTGLRDFLNAFADGFNNTAGVDSGNSSNYSVTSGYATPTSASSSTATSGSGLAGTGFTVLGRDLILTNGNTVASLGIYSTIAGTYTLKIALQNSTTSFDIVATQAASHGGAGWQDFTLSSPYAIPGSGTYIIGVYGNTGGMTTSQPQGNRSFKAGDQTGAGNTGWTAGNDTIYPMRATYQQASALDLRSGSRAITISPPTIADVYALVEETDALTLGTDFTLYASRNGNTSYVAGTATKLGTLANGLSLIAATGIDLTGQGSASNLRWRAVSANGKRFKIHAVAVYGR